MNKILFPCKIKNLNILKKHLYDNWSKNHILLKNKKLFNWYYKFKNNYNFLINKDNKNINSCIGLLFNSRKNKKKVSILNFSNQVIWLTLWSTDKFKKNISGLKLIFYLIKRSKKSIICTVGCNNKTYKIYKSLGFKCGELNHYYFINNYKKKFYLIKRKKQKINFFLNDKIQRLYSYNLRDKYHQISNLKNHENIFRKNYLYFKYKYVLNPFYKYKFYFYKDVHIYGFFVARETYFNSSRALRLVEFFGDFKKLKNVSYDLNEIIKKYNYEFIDFYNYGFEKKIIINTGFKLNNYTKNIIIPNYFEPFEKRNIKLKFSYFPNNQKMYLFKGDCDQDRPNLL